MHKITASLSFLEKLFAVVSLFLYMGGLLNLVLSGGQLQQNVQVEYDSGLIVLTFMVIYAITGSLLLLRWRQTLNVFKGDYIIIPFIALTFLSYFWSDAPDMTLRRSISLLGTSLFGVYLASRYTIRQQLELLAYAFALVLLLSTVFIVALPSYGISSGLLEGAWRGIFSHKNGLGLNMVVSAITFLVLAVSSNGKLRNLLFFCFLYSLFLLFMAQSGSALASIVVVIAALPIWKLLSTRSPLKLVPISLFILTAGFLAAVGLTSNPEFIFESLGEDSSFTGRTDFWPLVIDAIKQRPFLGYGFEAFWRGLSGASAQVYYALSKGPSHAHNGLLQIWLSLGFLGVVIFLRGFWLTTLRSAMYVRQSSSFGENYWPISFIIVFFLANIAESNIAEHNDIKWVLYVSLALSLANVFGRSGDSMLSSRGGDDHSKYAQSPSLE